MSGMNMDRRHKRLAMRELCSAEWPGEEGHEHRCKVFAGHPRNHICRCGSTTRRAIYLDGPMCVRELKPGVTREGHSLSDHVNYSEEDR